MDDKKRCQSCGMPLGEPGFYGTNLDGTQNEEYCKFCFQDGKFTYPDMTVDQAVEASVKYMVETLHFEEPKARQMSNDVIPRLRRWTS